jgi:hypothetical protein
MVLVRIISAVGEDDIGIDPLLQRFEPGFDCLALFREEAVPEGHDFDP